MELDWRKGILGITELQRASTTIARQDTEDHKLSTKDTRSLTQWFDSLCSKPHAFPSRYGVGRGRSRRPAFWTTSRLIRTVGDPESISIGMTVAFGDEEE